MGAAATGDSRSCGEKKQAVIDRSNPSEVMAMFSCRKLSPVLPFAVILCFLVLSAHGESGDPKTVSGNYPVVTFYVA